MESIVVTWRELLLAGVIILAVYIAEMLLLMRTGDRSQRTSRWFGRNKKEDVTDALLREELQRIRQRLDALEALVAPPPPLPVQAQAVAEKEKVVQETPYNRAIQMARQGRDAARISENCGISRGEAEFIVSMHKDT